MPDETVIGAPTVEAAKPAAKKTAKKPAAGGLKPRLSIPLDPDTGRAAVEVMSDDVRERYYKATGGAPAAAGQLVPPDAAPDGWDAEVCDFLYDSISKLGVIVAQRKGYSPEQARAVLAFTELEKTKLRAPTQTVLDKYFPGGLGRWGDEVMLAITLIAIANSKLDALRELPKPEPKAPAEVHQFPSANTNRGESQ